MKTSLFTASIGFLAVSAMFNLSYADTKAVYDSPDGQFTIEYRDDNHMRFGMGDNQFMLLTAGKGYILSREGNSWTAISVSDLQGMMPSADTSAEQTRLTPLGQKETIAGYEGDKYRVETGDGWDGWRDDGVVVLSEDPETRPTSQAMRRMAEMFSGMAQKPPFEKVDGIDIEKVGVLASGDMRLISLSSEKLSDNIFTLPPNVQIQQMPTAAMAGQTTASEEESNFLGDLFQGAQEEVANETERSTKQGVREAVRDGLRSLLD